MLSFQVWKKLAKTINFVVKAHSFNNVDKFELAVEADIIHLELAITQQVKQL